MRGKNPTLFTAGGISLAMAYQASNSIVAKRSVGYPRIFVIMQAKYSKMFCNAMGEIS